MAQGIKHLLHENKGLNLNPEHPCEIPGMAVCAYNPSTGGTWTGGIQELPGQIIKLNRRVLGS